MPDLSAVAAEQYLPVVGAVHDPVERRRVADLLRRAADQAQLLSNHAVVERCLTAAVTLTDAADAATLIKLHTGRHAALYSLGRLEEADGVYQTIDRLCTDPLERTEATLVQVSSLTNQSHPQEAVRLALDLLRQLGLAVPTQDHIGAEIDRGLDLLDRWVRDSTVDDDLRRPEIADPTLQAKAELIGRMMPGAYFCNQELFAWLTLEAVRIWAEHGPVGPLAVAVGSVTFVASARRGDYDIGRRAMRRILAVFQARGYDHEFSQTLFLYALGTSPWFEPLEDAIRQGQRAREGLVHSGDLQYACFTYYASMCGRLDCAPSLDIYVAEVEAALALARRTGNDYVADVFRAYRRLACVLRGEPVHSLAEDVASPDRLGGSQTAAASVHISRALGAALLDDPTELTRHAAAVMPLLPFVASTYETAVAHLMRALALADRARAAAPDERDALVRELDDVVDWLAARAEDAPVNFLHLLRLAEAERAWATGGFHAAVYAFDAAQREAAPRQRPWHQAFIAERAARFYLAHGIERTGHALLGEAREAYITWGATAKVDQLAWVNPILQARPDTPSGPDANEPQDRHARRSSIATGVIDLLSILAASQALSSETTIDGLRLRVADVLSTMTGATGVQLLVCNQNEQQWRLTTPQGDSVLTPLEEPGQQHLVPISAVRYVIRTREPLVVNDTTRDDRFAHDPYFAGLDCCSLLVAPVLNRGALQALLVLENRLIRGAFTTEQLDSVMLIAGQLTVSLDNANVYASLERKVAERTEALGLANERLALLSVTDALTGLANRRRLEDVLRAEWCRAQRSGLSVGFAMVDIDHFKLYNDQYGHGAGDKCLQRVATVLGQHVRDVDVVARYGGEEFAIVMPDTTIDAAYDVAERVRAAVAAVSEPHSRGTSKMITVSVGVAAMIPTMGSPAEHLVERADIELYRAKHAGRNQVNSAPP